uniref:MSP domain-containing protein n=1 Tax=Ascaris lumbricoides TaxID=6252 RepID=A0A0M3IRK2_ASCLU
MLYYVAFLALLSVSFAQQQQQQQQLQQRQRLQPALRATQCPYPNGTATAIHTFNCDTKHKMLVRSAKVLDEDGSEMYPINFKKPITIVLEAENNGDVMYNANPGVTNQEEIACVITQMKIAA